MSTVSEDLQALVVKASGEGAVFLIANASVLSAAAVAFVFFCALTRLFSDSGDERPVKQRPAEPRPRWEVLRTLNYLVIALFVCSITYVVFNYRTMSHSESGNGGLFPILVIWSGCMAYFFGFFGISFLDTNAMERSPSSFGLSHLDGQLYASSNQREGAGFVGASGKGGASNGSTVCSKETPELASSSPPVSASASWNSEKALSKRAAAPVPPPLGPILEGEEYSTMTDEEVAACVQSGKLKDHQLEKKLGDHARAVVVRRSLFERRIGRSMENLPFEGYDYERIFGANCEIVCGYIQIPVGVVGPLTLNGQEVYVPMATTEGCLVASTNRGCKAISQGGGCRAALLKDGITRAPCLRMPDAMAAADLKNWSEQPDNYEKIKAAFQTTTRFGKLQGLMSTVAGRNVYLRFNCFAGDAMGMNMISKGVLAAVNLLQEVFPEMELVAISGNMCTDKKSAAINWVEGRGKSIVCEARIPGQYVEATLKTTVKAMVETNIQKNLVGSAMAGALGGFNAHASNIVTAVFLATGQDPAQNVESSTCITLMEQMDNGDLLVSVNMPSIEVGTVGGGTSLPAQAACLDVVGCRGATQAPGRPGENAQQMAKVVAGATLAGELSLVAALASNQLVRAHMQHNRKPQPPAST
ncbi:unnamed protein product [Pylaiella littoralis]